MRKLAVAFHNFANVLKNTRSFSLGKSFPNHKFQINTSIFRSFLKRLEVSNTGRQALARTVIPEGNTRHQLKGNCRDSMMET
jgi:hypothetical protein